VSIVVQVAQGLRAAHRQTPSIVHRDLKPENIMLLDDGSVKVMDFGIAKVLEAMHKTTTQSVGTLQYMSPEQIDATGVDARSDLYCLGLVFYEMLSGRAPFDAASPRELLNRQCTEPPPPLPQQLRAALPRGVERLLLELLEKSPEQRPQTAAAVIRELEPFAPALGRSSAITEGLARPVDTAASKLDAKPAAPEQTLASNDSPQSAAASGRTPASARSARVQDTMELLESPRKPREITARTAWLTIVGLSLSAGMLTYWWRAADAASDIPGSAASTEQGPVRD
jgi:serine/threonine-protein kinase